LPKLFQKVDTGANRTTVSYNAGAVKIYNDESCLVSYENKNIFFYYDKRSSLCATTLEMHIVKKSEVVGLPPG
jgi:regulatory protein YycH of two-component signal transduction system YycFG